jgi:hypothetical protein
MAKALLFFRVSVPDYARGPEGSTPARTPLPFAAQTVVFRAAFRASVLWDTPLCTAVFGEPILVTQP